MAECVFMLVLALYRKLSVAQQSLRDGQWLQWELRSGSYDLVGKTVGIIGLGRIGRELAKRMRAFECPVVYTDTVRAPEVEELNLGVTYVEMDDLLQIANFQPLLLVGEAGSG